MTPELDRHAGSTRPEDAVGSVVRVCVVVLLLTVAVLFIADKQFYVSDDARKGRSAAAAYLDLNDRPLDVRLAPLRECYDIAAEKYGASGRDYRHFIFGCSGVWLAPSQSAD